MKPRWILHGAGVGALLFLYAPIGILMVFSLNASRISAVWEGWTWEWYAQLAGDQALWAATYNSLLVGLGSTIIALVCGIGAALVLERERARRWQILEGLLVLPLVIPEVMLGVALLLLFVLVKMPLSLLTVTIGHSVFSLPLTTVIIRTRLRKLDPRLWEAAHDLGATEWQVFRRITLPLLWPAIAGAGLMAFTVSFDDFVVTFFVAGPGSTTLPLHVFSMIRTGVSPAINALSALLVTVSMMLIGLSLLLQRK